VGGARSGEAGRRLHEVGARRLGRPAGSDLLVVGQVCVLEDDLDDRAGSMGDLDDGRDVCPDVDIPTRLERADVQHHVDLAGALLECPPRLEDLGRGQVTAVREPDDRADLHVRPGDELGRAGDVDGADGHRCDVVLDRKAAVLLDEVVVELGPEQRVIDRLRNVAVGESIDEVRHQDSFGM
jgi:hypothetical protein